MILCLIIINWMLKNFEKKGSCCSSLMRLPARLSTFSSARDSSPVMQPILRVIEYILYRGVFGWQRLSNPQIAIRIWFLNRNQSPNFFTFQKPRNRFQGIDSASLLRLAGRYDDFMPESTLYPQSGTMNLAKEVMTRVKDQLIVLIGALKRVYVQQDRQSIYF